MYLQAYSITDIPHLKTYRDLGKDFGLKCITLLLLTFTNILFNHLGGLTFPVNQFHFQQLYQYRLCKVKHIFSFRFKTDIITLISPNQRR